MGFGVAGLRGSGFRVSLGCGLRVVGFGVAGFRIPEILPGRGVAAENLSKRKKYRAVVCSGSKHGRRIACRRILSVNLSLKPSTP